MTIKRRFLLTCHDRSGSNLLRGMINQHPDIYVIPPLPIFEIIYYYVSAYGDLSDDDNWACLLKDIAALVEVNHYPLPHTVSYQEIVDRAVAAPRTLGSAVQTVFDLIGEKSGCEIIGLKFSAYHEQIDDFIRETNFDAVIFQYRDPRDVALSAYKAGVDLRTPEEFIRHWLEWHQAVRRIMNKHQLPVLEHKYEELLAEPTQVMDQIWEFFDVAECNNALDFFKGDEQKQAATTSYMWQNVSRPLQSDNKDKFYKEWGPFRTWSLERSIGRNGLSEFGYSPAALRKFHARSWFSAPVKRKRTQGDKEFVRRQGELAEKIKQRYLEAKQSKTS